MKKLLHQDLTYKINGVCFKAHRELGRFCRERQYCDKLKELLKDAGIGYEREYELTKLNKASPMGNRVDFLIEHIIILDIKAKKFITKDDYIQMLRYLDAANIELDSALMTAKTEADYIRAKGVFYSFYRIAYRGHCHTVQSKPSVLKKLRQFLALRKH